MKHKILKRDLKESTIVPIYLNYKEQQNYRGHAILLKRLYEREPPNHERIYEFYEETMQFFTKKQLKGNKKVKQILYKWEWWKIKFTTGNEKDFETAVKIAYYYKTQYNLKKE
jgi:hypothetical protein